MYEKDHEERNSKTTSEERFSNITIEETSFTLMTPQQVQQLVSGNYFGALRLQYGVHAYFNYQFGLTNTSRPPFPTWVTQRGTYGRLTGYWIFRSDARQCWQAVNTNGPLDMWNKDGHAKGNPEDWELFVFELVDLANSYVRVRNIYGAYVRFDGPSNRFRCDGNQANAANLIVEFQ